MINGATLAALVMTATYLPPCVAVASAPDESETKSAHGARSRERAMTRAIFTTNLLAVMALLAAPALAQTVDESATMEQSLALTPTGPWPADDQAGMGNTQGAGTWLRCAENLVKPGAKAYELSHERFNEMPQTERLP
jgi:hypothetical protein